MTLIIPYFAGQLGDQSMYTFKISVVPNRA